MLFLSWYYVPMIETKYPVKVPQPPAIMISQGKKYAVGGVWVRIPDDTTFENLYKYVTYEKMVPEQPLKKFHVSSSRGNTKYLIEVWNEKITCSCSGYRWRNKCKHTAAVKKHLKK